MGSQAQSLQATTAPTSPSTTKAPPSSSQYTPPSPTPSVHSPANREMPENDYIGDYHDPANPDCACTGSQSSPDSRRTILPLPKRQRLADSTDGEEVEAALQVSAGSGEGTEGRRVDRAERPGSVHESTVSLDVTKSLSQDRFSTGSSSCSSPPLTHSLNSGGPTEPVLSDPCPSLAPSPPLRSPVAAVTSLDPRTNPTYSSVFGNTGVEIVRSFTANGSPVTAGLFDGLVSSAGQSPLPSQVAKCRDGEDEDEDEGYEIRGNDLSSGESCQRQDYQRGSNKKKRKIPTVGRGNGDEESGDGIEGEGEDAEPSYADDRRSPESHSVLQTSGFVINKAPSNVPTTAKAALAKLRYRPPHVSLSRLCLSRRRHARRERRAHVVAQKPLVLTPPRPYTPPAFQSTGPPPLPPGSGLKGSKALKAAKKAEKDREKEKQRVKLALGGATLTLPNFWDPLGHAAAAARILRRSGVEIKSGYLTPPASEEGDTLSDDSPARIPRQFRESRPPGLDKFTFASSHFPLALARWRALQAQIEKLAVARQRAIQAREEEKERRREKEKEKALAAKEASTIDAKDPKKGSTPSVAAKKSLPNATTNRTSSSPLGELSSNTPAKQSSTSHSSSIPTPPPSNRKPPPKKGGGRKKRNAIANNLNPHHIFNYRPSRTPSSALHVDSPSTIEPFTSWPASEEALAAAGGSVGRNYFAGEDEWLCQFCEYRIFYGEDSPIFERLVKKRKDTLKVRARARARAAKHFVDSDSPNAPPPNSPTP